MPLKIPSLREKSGRAVVTLTDSKLHNRRTFYCGPWGSEPARQRYASLICQWQASGGRWPVPSVDPASITVVEIVSRYLTWAKGYYSKGETHAIRSACHALDDHCGDLPASAFGPVKLAEVRQRMITRGWNRKTANKQVHRVCAIFRWAAAQELVPVTIYQGLKTLTALRRGRCKAPEPDPVKPVAAAHVDAVLPFVSRQVRALIELQRLTGARGGELFKLRKQDIDRSDAIWRADLAEHKTEHHGHARTIYFGPQAQAVLAPWLMREDSSYLFSPAEAEDERIKLATERRIRLAAEGLATPLGEGNRAAGRRRKDIGPHYTADSYRRAIARGCDRADRWAHGGFAGGDDERLIPRWHPHQLRHAAATQIRKRHGLEAASLVLGHSSALVTEAVYAERDQELIRSVVQAYG